MKKKIITIVIFTILLIIPPFIMNFLKWRLFQESQFQLELLLWLTNTAGVPYSIITSVILLCVILFLFRKEKKIELIIILLFCIVFQQYLKVLIKDFFKEPRPYVVWLEEKNKIMVSDFYKLKDYKRLEFFEKINKQNILLKKQIKHWELGSNYSFPSGHTLFAASWCLLFIVFFWHRKYYILSVVLIIWTEGVSFSRMLLGMHWPIDVIVSIIISACFSLISYKIFNIIKL
ncbi:Phosphatidylglycerophosphatase B [Candidatus Providencia siddallii]|uniref:undecaprenyl-diphosphate phosphatase n=1 Tax=Candidatus Providencia siddallii TaxID=1715285 RepID=A0A0M6W7K9_9GAMM|nr:Phosphatidylglycerophosphatase B [Candidatus Providencia siddallii]